MRLREFIEEIRYEQPPLWTTVAVLVAGVLVIAVLWSMFWWRLSIRSEALRWPQLTAPAIVTQIDFRPARRSDPAPAPIVYVRVEGADRVADRTIDPGALKRGSPALATYRRGPKGEIFVERVEPIPRPAH